MFTKLQVASITLSFIYSVKSHMLLYKPQPFPSGDMPDNGPLNNGAGVTSNYPCKSSNGLDANGGPAYAFTFPRTELPAGLNYTVQFQGEAVHGGGSCQFSLTKDLEPTQQSFFKVINSIEGGCPAWDETVYLGDDSSATAIDPFTYPIMIPDFLENGQYTFAWTWFNMIGNREMYMGCAPVTVTGSSAKDSTSFEALPDLFLANIVDVECASPQDESVDMSFPDPGTSLQFYNPGQGIQPPVGDVSKCYAPIGQPHADSNSSTYIQPTVAPGTASLPPPATLNIPAPSSSVAASYALTSVAASATPSTEPSIYPSAVSSIYSSVVSSIYSSEMPSSTGSASSGACASGSVSCPTDGGVVCIGSSQFGICNFGCAFPQALAAGTSCSNGVISKRRLPPQARGFFASAHL